MSTPAKNTRLQKSGQKEGKLNKHSLSGSENSIAGNDTEEVESVKTENRIKSYDASDKIHGTKSVKSVKSINGGLKRKSIYRSIDSKKDALVQRWLATSQEFELNKTAESGICNWADAGSQDSSEVSFKVSVNKQTRQLRNIKGKKMPEMKQTEEGK